MSDHQYVYAVARIRGRELSLLSGSFLDQLTSARSYEECLQLLSEKGWGSEGAKNAEALLEEERKKTWGLIGELLEDLSIFDVFLYANDYHNLKAAMKEAQMAHEFPGIYIEQGTVEPKQIRRAMAERNYTLLPERMRQPAQEAYEALLHTGDGQLCDIIVDRAALDAIYEAGKKSNNEFLKLYSELTVVAADIKIAVRAQRTGKDRAFLERALAPCDTLNISGLTEAAIAGIEEIYKYLSSTPYAEAAEELRKSPSAFERWCDNLLIRRIRPQLTNSFGIGPLAAYILARENEMKSVRIVLSGKLNHLPEHTIRERIREMYV
ncbi:MAG: V-type ATPase subunit [Hungatella sp.]